LRRIIVGITGATGSIYGVELLRQLSTISDIESHLVMSSPGVLTASAELGSSREEIESLADKRYSNRNISAAIASGSFRTEAMIITPCSMKTLAAIANGMTGDLISRAADVALKERRTLVLMIREAPLNLSHLRNMVAVAEMGAIVYPPVPAFYSNPEDVNTMITHTVGRVMSLCGIVNTLCPEWGGLSKQSIS